jgi:hypothetical protein
MIVGIFAFLLIAAGVWQGLGWWATATRQQKDKAMRLFTAALISACITLFIVVPLILAF